MNNIEKGFKEWGVFFAVYKMVLFENRVTRIMFGIKTGNWRKMVDNVEFHNLYCLSDTAVLENSGKWVRNVEWMGMKVMLKRFLIGKQVGKRLFRRPV